ncbi:hypothetical protein AK812_SmicGene38002 [Symbiodinium microadriaticum]|uniref:Uncharacterized protein n=1 Tax=Symbiodinium microadriaticum TaxID=2951 RepID=A0A1Q9CET5_SYMMI|nr:hypothetical protein AK812_SmicGene38002 [Symbiodinium microadriaticum]
MVALSAAMENASLVEALHPEYSDGLEEPLSLAQGLLDEAMAAGLSVESFEPAMAAGRGHRAALSAAAAAASAWRQARSDLTEGLQKSEEEAMDPDAFQASLEAFREAEERLGALGLSDHHLATIYQDMDTSLQSAAMARLGALRSRAAREEALAELRGMLKSRGEVGWQQTAEALQSSLEKAREAGIEAGPELSLAEALAVRRVGWSPMMQSTCTAHAEVFLSELKLSESDRLAIKCLLNGILHSL